MAAMWKAESGTVSMDLISVLVMGESTGQLRPHIFMKSITQFLWTQGKRNQFLWSQFLYVLCCILELQSRRGVGGGDCFKLLPQHLNKME